MASTCFIRKEFHNFQSSPFSYLQGILLSAEDRVQAVTFLIPKQKAVPARSGGNAWCQHCRTQIAVKIPDLSLSVPRTKHSNHGVTQRVSAWCSCFSGQDATPFPSSAVWAKFSLFRDSAFSKDILSPPRFRVGGGAWSYLCYLLCDVKQAFTAGACFRVPSSGPPSLGVPFVALDFFMWLCLAVLQ